MVLGAQCSSRCVSPSSGLVGQGPQCPTAAAQPASVRATAAGAAAPGKEGPIKANTCCPSWMMTCLLAGRRPTGAASYLSAPLGTPLLGCGLNHEPGLGWALRRASSFRMTHLFVRVQLSPTISGHFMLELGGPEGNGNDVACSPSGLKRHCSMFHK